MESKPWFKSVTIVSSFLLITLTWAQGQGFISADEFEATKTVAERATSTLEAFFSMATVWGLRRAISPISGTPGLGLATAGAMAAVAMVGCASYDGARVAALAEAHAGDSAISLAECAAFFELTNALQAGPDQAVRFIGRGSELERLAAAAQRHGHQCAEIMSREGVSDAVLADLVASFDTTWGAALEATR